MALGPGSRIGHYEIVVLLGQGGMGEVYRARDAKLRREVAIKVLPEQFASDAGRLVRFEREARALAALNHANIAQIFGFEQAPGIQAFVMELVDGQTLDDLIAVACAPGENGLPLRRALTLAAQVAAALEAAHAQGILHRDLKPANIKVTESGVVKVLDFGLAAIADRDADPVLAQPTLTAVTEHGAAIGTPAYMSPQQARGEPVDRRTDVWAFGCLLFEMLSGKRAFDGRTSSDAMAAVLTRDPDWASIPATTPSTIVRLIRRCLQKDPASRLRDIGDARLEIEEVLGDGTATPAEAAQLVHRRPHWWLTAALVASAALAAGYGGWRLRQPAAPSAPVTRFQLNMPAGEDLALNEAGVPFAISPDGSQIVVSAGSWQGSQLYLRSLGAAEPTVIPGTISAFHPFFSPDGQWIAFLAGSILKKVPSAGGPVLTICEIEGRRIQGGVWTADGIVFAPGDGAQGLARVSADGGAVQPVTTVNRDRGETSHGWPDALPGGTHLIYTVHFQNEASQVVLHSLSTGERRVLFQGASRARYVPGYLLYAQGSDVFAAPFDLGRLEVTGGGVRVIGNVSLGVEGATQYDVAQNGTIVHQPGVRADQRLMAWVDRRGQRTALKASPRTYEFPRLSPDGQMITVTVREGGQRDQWLYRPQTDSLTRLTFKAGIDNAEWTTDGRALVFGAAEEGGMSMFLQNIDGSSARQRLFGPASGLWPGSWTSDGRTLAFMENGAISGDIKLFDRSKTITTPLIDSKATEWGARISPDNRWMAYVSNESGRWQVYVQPFPGPGGRLQLSTEGGSEVVWARNGRELFYRNGPRMMAVAIDSHARVAVGQTTVLFEAALAAGQPGLPDYDVSADGHFVMIEPGPEERAQKPLEVTLNWPALLDRR